MTWLEKRKDWLTSGGRLQRPRERRVPPEAVSVSVAAGMLGVDPKTVLRKYMALEPDEDAPIPFGGWFRLPGGHFRIYLWAIRNIMD